MAEEVLVKEALTEDMIRGGEALTRQLDEKDWPITAAFWDFDIDNNRWKLILAYQRLNIEGHQKAYETIGQALNAVKSHFVSSPHISVVAPDDPRVRALAAAARTYPWIVGSRIAQNMINRHFFEDAYLYRVDPSVAQT